MESFINFKSEEWLLKGDGLDSVEVQNMDYVLEFDEFVRSIKQNMDTKFSMFLGAGASVESGVPSAGECIWEWKRDIFISKNPVLAETHNNIKSEQVKRSIQNWLDNQGIYPQLNSEEEYSKYIEAAYKIADDRRKYFQHLIEGKCPSLGYHIIALLAENEIVKSVWTTNFDGLMLKTAHSYGLVPIEVTLESQDRIFRNDTDKELLCIALHGDYKYAMHLKFEEDAAHDKILNEQYREEHQYKYQYEEKNKMYHDLSDDYKSRDYVIAITVKEGEYYGNIFYEYNYGGYGLSISIMRNLLDFVENLDCEEIDALNEEGLLNNNIGLKSDINGKEIHFELKNERGDILKKTIPEGELQKYIVGYEMIRCDGHGMKKERRRCSSCQNFKPIEGCAKGNCTARGDVVQRSRIICAFDYVPNKNECFNEDIS